MDAEFGSGSLSPAGSLRPQSRDPLPFAVMSLLVLAFIVYGRGVSAGFVDWDDTELILNNPLLRAGASLSPAFFHPYAGLYAPLTYALYAAIAAAARAAGTPLDSAYFHGTSIVVHAAGGVLLLLWLRRLCGETVPAALGAAVWLVHPLQTESVAWASGMNAVLAGVLGVAALWSAAEGVVRTGRARRGWLVGSAAAAAASLGAKPSGILLPVMLLAVHRLILRRLWKETLLLAGAWAAVLTPFAVVGRTAQVTGMIEFAPPLLQRFAVAGHAVGFYFGKVFWPTHLAIDYGLTPAVVLETHRWIAPTACAVFVLAGASVVRRRWPWVLAGIIVFAAAIAPVLGFVPFYFQSYSTVADRYAYLAMAGVAVVVTFATRGRAGRRLLIARSAVCVWALALAIVTAVQVGVWHDTPALMAQAYAVNPDSIAANGQLGMMAQRAGRFGFAEQAFRKVLDRRPYDGAIRAQYAGVLLQTGRAGQATAEFVRVVNEQPDNARAFNGLGLALVASGHAAEALPAFGQAARLDPTLADAPANAGDVLWRLGETDKARAAYRIALRIDARQSKALAGLGRSTTAP